MVNAKSDKFTPNYSPRLIGVHFSGELTLRFWIPRQISKEFGSLIYATVGGGGVFAVFALTIL